MSGDITSIAEGLSIKGDFYASKLSWLRKNVSDPLRTLTLSCHLTQKKKSTRPKRKQLM